MKVDHYTVLGIASDASQAEIKRVYRAMAALHHPDKGGDAEVMARVNAAYACLSDPEKRAYYDQHGQEPDEKPTMEADAERLFHGLVKTILDAPGFDPLHVPFKILEMLGEELEQRRVEVKKLRRRQEVAEGLAEKYQGKPGFRNSYQDAFLGVAAESRQAAEGMTKMIETMELMEKMAGSAQHPEAKYKDYISWQKRRDDNQLQNDLIAMMKNSGGFGGFSNPQW